MQRPAFPRAPFGTQLVYGRVLVQSFDHNVDFPFPVCPKLARPTSLPQIPDQDSVTRVEYSAVDLPVIQSLPSGSQVFAGLPHKFVGIHHLPFPVIMVRLVTLWGILPWGQPKCQVDGKAWWSAVQ